MRLQEVLKDERSVNDMSGVRECILVVSLDFSTKYMTMGQTSQ